MYRKLTNLKTIGIVKEKSMYTEKILQYGPYACIAVTVVCIVLALYFRRRDKKLKRKNNEEAGVVYDEETLKQDIKNREVIAKIISGHYKEVSIDTQRENNESFAVWQKTQRNLFATATDETLLWREKIIESNNLEAYSPEKITTEPTDVSGKTKIFSDIFTEPFPSLHDMAEHALITQFIDLMILNDISPTGAKSCSIVIKEYFVNHKMVTGIIRFDVYK